MPTPTSEFVDGAPRRLSRIAGYYLIAGILGFALVHFVPIVADAVSGGALDEGVNGGAELFGPGAAPVGQVLDPESPWYMAAVATVSMLGTLVLMIPVTWVYLLTRGERGHDESVVHTLLILPIAVTGIVMVVKSSVALAFSLAGIVAAVRFRATLEDTKDAVYVFLAIGVGLASGIQSLGIAVALSLVFNAVVLVLWRTGFGDEGSPTAALAAGIAEGSTALQRLILEERGRKRDKRANALIMVHSRAAEESQPLIEEVLGAHASRWKLADIAPGPRGVRLAYLVRFDDEGSQGAVMDRLRAGSKGVVEAELRSLKGIKAGE